MKAIFTILILTPLACNPAQANQSASTIENRNATGPKNTGNFREYIKVTNPSGNYIFLDPMKSDLNEDGAIDKNDKELVVNVFKKMPGYSVEVVDMSNIRASSELLEFLKKMEGITVEEMEIEN